MIILLVLLDKGSNLGVGYRLAICESWSISRTERRDEEEELVKRQKLLFHYLRLGEALLKYERRYVEFLKFLLSYGYVLLSIPLKC